MIDKIKDAVWQYASERDYTGDYEEVDDMLTVALKKMERYYEKKIKKMFGENNGV